MLTPAVENYMGHVFHYDVFHCDKVFLHNMTLPYTLPHHTEWEHI